MLWVVDAHTEYQSSLNVPSLAVEGYSAIIVKATQGATGYTAPGKFDQWLSQARVAGLIPGAYHWLTGANAGAQLDHFLGRIGNPDGMLIAVDVEDNDSPPSYAVLEEFVRGWYARTNNHPILIYSGNWWWSARGWNGANLSPYLWDSRYVNGSGYGSSLYSGVADSWWQARYGGWSAPTLLQFTSKGTVGGINGNVDLNAFRGNIDELRSLTRSGGGTVSQKTDELIWAWSQGINRLGDGTIVCPVDWRIRDEAWQAAVDGKLAELGTSLAEIMATLAAVSTPPPVQIDYTALAKALISELGH